MTITKPTRVTSINVREHGAIGDGVTDDTDAIQSAIDRLETTSPPGGVLCFPKGVYLVTEREDWYCVRFRSGNFTVRGVGMDSSVILQGTRRAPAFFFKPCCDDTDGILIEHLGFKTNDPTPDDGFDPETEKGSMVAIVGLTDDFYSRAYIQNCLFDCPMRTGLYLSNIRVCYVHASTFKADSPAYHIVCAKPLVGQWDLYLRHPIWQDCNEVLVGGRVNVGAGTGSGEVIIHDDSGTITQSGVVMEVHSVTLTSGATDDYASIPFQVGSLINSQVWVPRHIEGDLYTVAQRLLSDPSRVLRISFGKGVLDDKRVDVVITRSG